MKVKKTQWAICKINLSLQFEKNNNLNLVFKEKSFYSFFIKKGKYHLNTETDCIIILNEEEFNERFDVLL